MNVFQRILSWFRPQVSALSPQPSTAPAAAAGPRALDLILEFEGLDQPAKRPPGGSGITLGHGYDLGFYSETAFRAAWSRHLAPHHIDLLSTALGKKGAAAEAIKERFRPITITPAMAREVFDRCTLPDFRRRAAATFPGLHVLTPDQQGVLVSLVFNRGTQLKGERRREMANIAAILAAHNPAWIKAAAIARQILAMQRIWPSDSPASGHPGLRRRRRAEAALMSET